MVAQGRTDRQPCWNTDPAGKRFAQLDGSSGARRRGGRHSADWNPGALFAEKLADYLRRPPGSRRSRRLAVAGLILVAVPVVVVAGLFIWFIWSAVRA